MKMVESEEKLFAVAKTWLQNLLGQPLTPLWVSQSYANDLYAFLETQRGFFEENNASSAVVMFAKQEEFMLVYS